jgi:hypothetical protein
VYPIPYDDDEEEEAEEAEEGHVLVRCMERQPGRVARYLKMRKS